MARKPVRTRADVMGSSRLLIPLFFLLFGTWLTVANASQEGFMLGVLLFLTGVAFLVFFAFAPLAWIRAFDDLAHD